MQSVFQQFLDGAPLWVSLFIIGVPTLLTGMFLFAAFWAWQNAGALCRQNPVYASGLSEGYQLVQGVAEVRSRLNSPLTGRECAWYDFKIDEAVETVSRNTSGLGSKVSYSWSTVREGSSPKPILLHEGDATCHIKVDGATAYVTDWSEWYGSGKVPKKGNPEKHPGVATPGGAGRIEIHGRPEGRFRYLERYIYPGDPVFALGNVRQTSSGKQGQRKFILKEPNGKQPFIVSTRSPKEIQSENQLAVQGGLVMSAICGAASVFLLILKFG